MSPEMKIQAAASPVKIREVTDLIHRDKPENPRDWDFEGSWEQLVAECRRDREESGATAHLADEWDTGAWSVWRVFP